MFSLLFTSWGRNAIIGIFVVMAMFGIYRKIRSDAILEIELQANADALKRVGNAIRAGDTADVSPDRLFKSDGHKRD